jgi:tRNA modification GTPase
VTLADTAGLRAVEGRDDPQSAIEEAGMARARERAASADIKLLLVDLEAALADAAVLDGVDALYDHRSILVLNKIDRCTSQAVRRLCVQLRDWNPVTISARTGEGIEQVLARLVALAEQSFAGAEAGAGITRVRHRRALEDCRDALVRAQAASLPELVAEELRLAVRALGRISGRVDVEDILDVVFADFCIGK